MPLKLLLTACLTLCPCLGYSAGLRRAGLEDAVGLVGLPPWRARDQGGGGEVEGPLRVIQTAYRDPVNGNVTLLLWEESAPNAGGVNIFVDGALLGTLPTPGLAFVTDLEPGLRAFRVAEAGVPEPTFAEAALEILEKQPFDDPTDLRCGRSLKEDGDTCTLEVSWTNSAFLPSYYILLLDETRSERTEDAELEVFRLPEVSRGPHRLRVVGFLTSRAAGANGLYRGSFVETTCTVADCELNRFLRGSCDGLSQELKLTSAIFALSYLFLGGATPPCIEACDLDRNGAFVLSDPIYLLNYLFLGGPPPAGWIDSDGDGVVEPTCESTTIEDCADPHPACN